MGALEFSGETVVRRSRQVIRPATPAPGAEWTLTVPAGHVYRILAIGATLVTSTTAGTRVANLGFSDGVKQYVRTPAQTSQAESLTRYYAWYPESAGDATGNGINSPMPDGGLMAGWSVYSITDGSDAADQWSDVAVLVIDDFVESGAVNIDEIPELIVAIR